MGDNDTKRDARQLCYIEAKRRLIEKVGVYVESETIVNNYILSKDQIRSYSTALLSIEIVQEEIKFSGSSIIINMTLSTKLDRETFKNQLLQIVNNNELKQKIEKQQNDLNRLYIQIRNIQDQLASSNTNQTIQLRKDRNVIFQEMDEIDKMKLQIKRQSSSAVSNVTSGMTLNEVRKILGAERSMATCLDHIYLNYGNVWIWCPNGVVKGYIEIENWKGPCASASYNSEYKRY